MTVLTNVDGYLGTANIRPDDEGKNTSCVDYYSYGLHTRFSKVFMLNVFANDISLIDLSPEAYSPQPSPLRNFLP